MNLHASGLTGVSPKTSACWAWTFGVVTYFIQRYAQFGCGAFFASIHVSAQPVAPSRGTSSFTGALSACSASVWYGHDAPIVASPLLKRLISSVDEFQYFLTSGRCCLSRPTAASNCVWLSSYGYVIPRLAFVFIRYSAASAIWIGLFGTVTLPLNLEL